jgi:Flavodoxin.
LIFYSRTGTTRALAERVARELESKGFEVELLGLEPEREYGKPLHVNPRLVFDTFSARTRIPAPFWGRSLAGASSPASRRVHLSRVGPRAGPLRGTGRDGGSPPPRERGFLNHLFCSVLCAQQEATVPFQPS